MLEIQTVGGLGKLRIKDFTPVFHQFAAYMQAQTDRTFAEAGRPGSARAGGSSESRGISWLPVQKAYKVRPSGFPVTLSSGLLQDTGELRRRAATDIVKVTPLGLLMGTNLKYANYQNELRPFLFFTEQDADKLVVFTEKFMTKKIKEGNDEPRS